MDDARFWAVLEEAWRAAPEEARHRPPASDAAGRLDEVDAALEAKVLPALRRILRTFTADDLAAFDRILEKKLFDLDRADVQAQTDGSDDGFLYARGFIVGMGQGYYERVMTDPSRAFADRECPSICYLPRDLFEDAHGPLEPSGISRESCSNPRGWPAQKKH